ncbi:MAG: ParB N-terminal domain-containing protein [Desulfosarcina sp.]
MSETIAISPVEIAHLELAYAHTRIRHPRQIVAMADSLLRCGQLVPIVVVAAKKSDFVLIDGYQRVAAARRAGLDTLQAQIWPGAAGDALCRLLATDGARQFGIFEQAALLRELKTTHGMNQSRIAAQMGRHPSWVTRRLALIEGLPHEAIKAVRDGHLSSWSASRVLVPLARANAAHACSLVQTLAKHRLTSRQLERFWQHYQKANRAAREKMFAAPILWFKSLDACQAEEKARVIADGPEGHWLRDLGIVAKIIDRLSHLARQVFGPGQSIRKISQLMKMSRKTIQRILTGQGAETLNRPSRYEPLTALIIDLYQRLEGNCVLIQSELAERYGQIIPYTSLTHLVRSLNLRPEKIRRSGTFTYAPGQEAQHDTSTHRMPIAGKPVKAQCASMVQANSRLLFFQYYPRLPALKPRSF